MRRIGIACLALLVFACTTEENKMVQGTAVGLANGTAVYLQELGEGNKMIALDTALINEERFSFSKTLEGKDKLNILTVSGQQGRLLLIQDQQPLTISIYKDSIAASKLEGSDENELFYDYVSSNRYRNTKKAEINAALQQARRETDGVMVEQHTATIKDIDANFITDKKALIEKHSSSMVAVMALSDLINAKVVTVEDSEGYYNAMADNIQNSTVGKSIKKYIAQQKSQRIAAGLASVGNKAPSFSAPTPDGKELALSETLGKYTIVDFWASWCRPCRMENPNVVRVYNKYHDKGLNIISVSLDRKGQDARWKQAIEKDKMDWYHVSNLNYWQDPIARSYGVRSIPATFLLDENGIIIAKNLRGNALEAKISELLGS